MIKRKLLLPVAIIAAVMLAGFTSCSPGDLKAFEGILQKFDSLSGNVTVTLSDNTTATFNLKDIDLKTIRQALGDASLEPGDNVTGKQGRHGEVKELKVRNAETQGIIKSLGTDNVTITTKKGDITLKVTPETQIKGGGKEKPVFSDLKVGQRIEVKYDVSSLKALKIVINANGKIQDNHDNQGNKGNKD
jgi:preprotein translocase subunit YajC